MHFIDIFCKVIDNFGDIGVTYRLSKELNRFGYSVNLFVDNLISFNKINSDISLNTNIQKVDNITVHKWDDSTPIYYIPSKIVIESFACDLGTDIINKIKQSNSLLINLEYLSAEKWVEDCHKVPSLLSNGVNKFFFFPGFTSKTGGLNYEHYITQIDKNLAKQRILDIFKISKYFSNYFFVLFFTYSYNNLENIIVETLKIKKNCLLFIPNLSNDKKNELYNKSSNILKEYNADLLIVNFEMIHQQDFNLLLKSSDLNIVRGEDSFTQAIISKSPFIWDIYKQEDNAHIDKLYSFLEYYTSSIDKSLANIIIKTFLNFNISTNTNSFSTFFREFMLEYEKICVLNKNLVTEIENNGNLASNLIIFIEYLVNTYKGKK